MSEEPGSTIRAPMSCFAISARAFARRAANSSWPIGLTSPVIDLRSDARSLAIAADHARSGLIMAAAAAAAPNCSTSRRLISSPRLVRLVRFFLDDRRAELRVDALLDRGPFVVGDVDGARELDEFLSEALRVFFIADLVLDDPEHLVHPGELGLVTAEIDRGRARILPGLFEQRELVVHVRDLLGVGHARGLDAQDGDLVEQ